MYGEEEEAYEENEMELGEIAVGPATFAEDGTDPITATAFDYMEEALWVGTATGALSQLSCPTLERFSVFPYAHPDAVLDIRSLGSAIVSVSPAQMQVHTTGCAPVLTYRDATGDLSALQIEASGRRALVGRASGGITLVDLVTGKAGSSVDTGNKGVVGLRGPLGNDAVVVGTADGCISLLDARNNYRPSHTMLSHAGGLAAVDASDYLVATCGYSGRMGQLSLEYTVKVYDVRGAPRMIAGLPFAAGPTLLRFHPLYPTTLIVGAATGEFTLLDALGQQGAEMYFAVDTGGDGLACVDISASGECIAFGGHGGYVHLWSHTDQPTVVGGEEGGDILEMPEAPETPPSLAETDFFSNVPAQFPADGWSLASQLDQGQLISVGLPPRVIDDELLAGMKQSDFVGYIQNPKAVRGGGPGKSAAAVAPLRNKRLEVKAAVSAEEAKAIRARQRAEKGGIILPGRYRRVAIKQQTGSRFEEFDFSFYNRTPFVGLENDLANCYTNPLLQMLYFIPSVRNLALQQVPEVDKEFTLTCELGFLFRMLSDPDARICQAANFLRALRQNREASVLGLVEGVKGERGSADIEVETHKDKSIARRVQSLLRFLLEQLHKELSQRLTQPAAPSSKNSNLGNNNKRGGKQSKQQQEAAATTVESSNLPDAASSSSGGSTATTPIEEIFAVSQKQRTRCLSRTRPDQVKLTRTFQIDMQYPEIPKEGAVSEVDKKPAAAETKDSTTNTAAGVTSPKKDASANQSTAATDQSATPDRPSFAQILEQSLHYSSDMRAWFDQETGYQYVRQERVPAMLPQILVVNADLQDKANLKYWQPVELTEDEQLESEGGGVEGQSPTYTSSVKGEHGEEEDTSVAEFDEDTATDRPTDAKDKERRRPTKPWLPFAVSIHTNPEQWSVTVKQGTTVEELLLAADQDGDGVGSEEEGVKGVYELTALLAHIVDEDEAALGGADYEGHLLAHIKVPEPYLKASKHQNGSTASTQPTSASQKPDGSLPDEKTSNTPAAVSPPSHHPLDTTTIADHHHTDTKDPHHQPSTWTIFNDFHMTPCLKSEVTELYGGQKIPCLLFFTRIDVEEKENKTPLVDPVPVMNANAFLQLCRAPPLQGPRLRRKPKFVPLGADELPRPGLSEVLLGLDAEFVAYSPPEKVVRRGIEVEARPSRLGLGRVSVVRGTGTSKGVPCIDDYIRSVEPVYDYLTRYSGLIPGDLDAARSPHHLTTLRRAYIKLMYLVDAGCIFVGHGLRKDFRMINIVVPSKQIIDTVDLFYKPRTRRLSLRFLAGYILKLNIQGETHDSIEDAVTALKLYEAYRALQEAGTFEQTLNEMYEWGARNGWEPSAWDTLPDGTPNTLKQPPTSHQQQPMAALGGGPGLGPPPPIHHHLQQQQQHLPQFVQRQPSLQRGAPPSMMIQQQHMQPPLHQQQQHRFNAGGPAPPSHQQRMMAPLQVAATPPPQAMIPPPAAQLPPAALMASMLRSTQHVPQQVQHQLQQPHALPPSQQLQQQAQIWQALANSGAAGGVRPAPSASQMPPPGLQRRNP